MTAMRRRLVAAAATTVGLAMLAPASGAGAQVIPPIGAGVNQPSAAGCAGSSRPSTLGGNTGSSTYQSCEAVLNFQGPSIGQISSVIGPTIMGVALSPVVVSAGSAQVIGALP
jgi:hypothetical protein